MRLLHPALRDGERRQWLLDDQPVSRIRVKEVFGGGGVWIDGAAQFDLRVLRGDGSILFEVPSADDSPDWYVRLDSGPYGLVDWTNEAFIRETQLLDQERIRCLLGSRALDWIEDVRRLCGITYSNASELLAHLDLLDEADFALHLTTQQNTAVRNAYGSETDRLLHNFLSSARTRVDLQRRLIRTPELHSDDWPPPDLPLRIEALTVSGLVAFVHELRNYNLHHRLPPGTYSTQFAPGSFQVSYLLPVPLLLKGHEWTSGTRTWLTGEADDLELRTVVRRYVQEIRGFDEWLIAAFLESHSTAIQVLRDEVSAHIRRF